MCYRAAVRHTVSMETMSAVSRPMGLVPLHLELWVLSHCPLYSVVSHIDRPPPQLLREQSPIAYTQTSLQWLPPLWHSLLITMSSVTVRSQSAAVSRGLSLTALTQQFCPTAFCLPTLFYLTPPGVGEGCLLPTHICT